MKIVCTGLKRAAFVPSIASMITRDWRLVAYFIRKFVLAEPPLKVTWAPPTTISSPSTAAFALPPSVKMFRNSAFNPSAMEDEAVAEYVRAFSLPGSIRCTLEDYRAGATVDAERDLADKREGRRLEPPTLVLWGAEGGLPRLWPVMDIWQKWARNVRGEAIEQCGHYLPEEQPEIVARKMLAFLKGD